MIIKLLYQESTQLSNTFMNIILPRIILLLKPCLSLPVKTVLVNWKNLSLSLHRCLILLQLS